MNKSPRSSLKIFSFAAAALLFTATTALAYEKDGSVVTRKNTGGGVAVAEPTTPPPSERKAGGTSPVKAPIKDSAQATTAARSGTAGGEALSPAGNSPLGYTAGGGVQSPGGERTCHVRGFKDPTGLIIEDHYQKCGTIINGVTSTCYADGRCRLSY